ncbi:guanine nucleotide-binding, putative [Babesia ovis]|uniref:Guanine nucleotide-binding, putative n=1 Tax=Babesia ovis TaxID=5869 RepID=A0A9W5WUI9_BABOV|nr:guanine nucleotide-binding, putative [Babesia ovis]
MLLVPHSEALIEDITAKNHDGSDVYLNGSVISPDGSVFAAVFSDARITIYPSGANKNDSTEVEPIATSPSTLSPEFHIRCNDDVRSVSFFPNFKREDPDSCCLLAVSRGSPIHLYDTHSGQKHFTYKPNNLREEMAELYSLDFHPLGKYFMGGSRGTLHIFDIERPGQNIEVRPLSTKNGRKFGLISSISHNPYSHNIHACGDYNSQIGVFDHNESRHKSLFEPFSDSEHNMGPINQLKWLNESIFLVGSRTDIYIRAYDIRGTIHTPIMRFKRPATTNQKITFDVNDNILISGTSDGDVVSYDLVSGNLTMSQKIAKATVSSTNIHPNYPLLLTSTGSRLYKSYVDEHIDVKSALQMWKIKYETDC